MIKSINHTISATIKRTETRSLPLQRFYSIPCMTMDINKSSSMSVILDKAKTLNNQPDKALNILNNIPTTNNNKMKISNPQTIIINDSDLRETFIKGRGPGGQKINKTNNCVQLLHVPSGIIINCQETRDLQSNRKIARKMLRDKLDLQMNGDMSRLGKKYDKIRKQKQQQIQ